MRLFGSYGNIPKQTSKKLSKFKYHIIRINLHLLKIFFFKKSMGEKLALYNFPLYRLFSEQIDWASTNRRIKPRGKKKIDDSGVEFTRLTKQGYLDVCNSIQKNMQSLGEGEITSSFQEQCVHISLKMRKGRQKSKKKGMNYEKS